MSMTIEATSENGVLKPKQPLPLKEQEQVRITVEPTTTWAERTAGMLKWTGDPAELEHLALDPQFDPQESA
jgi:predicted DNA-binding antitoxin AbrB/MazE fold protein